MTHWTEAEENIIKELYPTTSAKDLVEKLPNRNEKSIALRACKLNIKKDRPKKASATPKLKEPKIKKLRQGKRWSVNELQILQNMVEDRATSDSLCLEFDRPFGEIVAECDRIALNVDYLFGDEPKKIVKKIGEQLNKPDRPEAKIDIDLIINVRSVRVQQCSD